MKTLLLLFIQVSLISNLFAQTDSGQLAVGLKDGTLISPKSLRSKSPLLGRQYLLVNDSMKVDLKTVRFYQDATGYYQNDTPKNSSKEQLFKRDYKGEISIFSQLKTNYVPSTYGGGYGGGGYAGGYMRGGFTSTSKMIYLQKGNGDMELLNYANAYKAASGNTESLKKLAQAKKLRTVELTSYLAGAALLISGIAHTTALNEETGPPPYPDTSIKISPLLIGGAAVISVPFFTKTAKKRKLIDAITIFNAG